MESLVSPSSSVLFYTKFASLSLLRKWILRHDDGTWELIRFNNNDSNTDCTLYLIWIPMHGMEVHKWLLISDTTRSTIYTWFLCLYVHMYVSVSYTYTYLTFYPVPKIKSTEKKWTKKELWFHQTHSHNKGLK